MKIKMLLIFVFSLMFTFFAFKCTNVSSVEFSGNGTGTGVGNPVVTGTIYDPVSKKAAKKATVKLRKANYLKDSTKTNSITYLRNGITDDNGIFSFDSLDTGSYNYCHSIILKVSIKSKKDTIITTVDTLKTNSKITGYVRTTTGQVIPAIIQIYGLDRWTFTSSTGSFSLSVPPGVRYTIVVKPIYTSKYKVYEYSTSLLRERDEDDLGKCDVEDDDHERDYHDK
jgi:hypothetical protein